MSSHTIICLWFPYLSVETAFKNEPEFTKKPFSTIEEYKKRQILHSINPFGRSLGLKPGLGLYEAHTLCENLKTEKRDYKKELASLKMYAKWCYQLTPRVSVEKENTIMLNLSLIHI